MTEKNDNKTLYGNIVQYLKEKIYNGEILPDEKLPTESELSLMFNVSRITSKRALDELENEKLIYRTRGKGSYVSPMSHSKNDKSKVIAIVIPFEDSNGKLVESIRGVLDVLNRKGYFLTINRTEPVPEKERELLKALHHENVLGIIYYPSQDNFTFDLLYNFSLYNFPIVTIDKHFDGLPISYVIPDNFDGGYKATKHLLKLGHKRIAYLANSNLENKSSVKQRYYGYCKALIDNGILVDDNIIKFGLSRDSALDPYDPEYGAEYRKSLENMVKELMQKGVTAIHTENDNFAVNLISACNDIGVNIPEQLSIIGFDNSDICKFINVPLTTIEQDFYETGKRAAEIIVKKIEISNTPFESSIIPVKLIERQSCITIK